MQKKCAKSTEDQERRIEYCCLCGAKTEYVFDTPIQERKNYIVGVGQLCCKCAYALQKESSGIFVE